MKLDRLIPYSAHRAVLTTMLNEMSADMIAEVASPAIAAIEEKKIRTHGEWQPERTTAPGWQPEWDIPDWTPASARALWHRNSVPEIHVETEPTDKGAGLVVIDKAINELQNQAMLWVIRFKQKIGRNGYRNNIVGMMATKIAMRAFGIAASNLFAYVFDKKKKGKGEFRLICTSSEKWLGKHNPSGGGTVHGKFNGVKAYKLRVGRPALSKEQWMIRYWFRYHARLKTKRRQRMRDKTGKKLVVRARKITVPATKYGRPVIYKKRVRNHSFGKLGAKLREIVRSRVPYNWKWWNEGHEYWTDTFMQPMLNEIGETIADEIKSEVRDRTRDFTRSIMDSLVVRPLEAGRAKVEAKVEQYTAEEWINRAE